MIAKNGDKVIVTRNAEDDDGFVIYEIGERGVMVNKSYGESAGGWVSLDSEKVVYLFKDEYEVVAGETASEVATVTVTAESLRNRFLEIEKEEQEISKKIDALSEEKSKIEDDLRLMGFMLCSPVQQDFMPILDDSPEIDYNDWRNWKKGDVVECVSDDGWEGSFISGSLYTVSDKKGTSVWIESDDGEEYVSHCINDFKFHSPF